MYEQPVTSVCIICEQEFPTTEEFWYKRSDRPGNVHLGRCRECSREYKRTWRPKKEYEPEETCSGCEETFPLTSEYWYVREDGTINVGRCRKCRAEYKSDYLEHSEDLGKRDMVYSEPYTYASRWQRVTTESFLRSIGWRKMERGGWFKPGIKEEDGRWTNMPKDVIRTGDGKLTQKDREYLREHWKEKDVETWCEIYNSTPTKVRLALIHDTRQQGKLLRDQERKPNGKINYDFPVNKKVKGYKASIDKEERQQILDELLEGKTHREVAQKFNRSKSAVRSILVKHFNENEKINQT